MSCQSITKRGIANIFVFNGQLWTTRPTWMLGIQSTRRVQLERSCERWARACAM